MARTVAFCTLGCKVNQYDSQAMLEKFEDAGFQAAPFSAPADVYVINTCTVTGMGDKKSRQMIRRANRQNPGAAIVVTGCMAQRAAQSVLLPGVRLVLGTQRRGEVVKLLQKAMARKEALVAVEPLGDAPFELLTVRGSAGRTRGTLKIQEGCENHCAYCVIPSVRGKVRSRPLAEVCREAERLAGAGYQEIVVTGIHLSSYGRDFEDGTTLLDALRGIARAEGVRRVRLGSLEPGIVTEAFAGALKEIPAICPQFMLALQSGSDTVLRRMGRQYDTARYAEAVECIRRAYPSANITTDVMTGFPGETDAEFWETMAFVERMRFGRIHVFPYSRREGTTAAEMPHQVPKALREARAAELIALGERLEAEYIAGWQGKACEVLFEESRAGGVEGYTREYVRVAGHGAVGSVQRVHAQNLMPDGKRKLKNKQPTDCSSKR
ncbi:MAG: tRNA (N(6)-L-threonylcarbamoyladenosine(37)-C(2))-methylthiotransferase MtaB [Firmicutes bacterium]|nr:tRNA (N(6)-L-threonylcarbamoyladenosine(37)-C(2))-methylthiotransferase MtaB [Bacillota bacterium]